MHLLTEKTTTPFGIDPGIRAPPLAATKDGYTDGPRELIWVPGTLQSRSLTAQGQNRMAKAPAFTARPKGGKTAHPSGVGKKRVSGAGNRTADSKTESVSASSILRDIQDKAADLSTRADRLLQRVS